MTFFSGRTRHRIHDSRLTAHSNTHLQSEAPILLHYLVEMVFSVIFVCRFTKSKILPSRYCYVFSISIFFISYKTTYFHYVLVNTVDFSYKMINGTIFYKFFTRFSLHMSNQRPITGVIQNLLRIVIVMKIR